jgi:phosphoribosylaminoimidazolecarboxamide formyltransferase/IMP cyclohydrolase
MIRYALISVSDKTQLEPFAHALVGAGYGLLSTGGTARFLRDLGLEVKDVSDVTQFPEIMDGRVKTLHPAVHGGLLARRDDPAHLAAMQQHAIADIAIVVVNLYPFAQTLAASDGEDASALIEQIDIGGPAMIRAAAKNHAHVTIVTDPADYPEVADQLPEPSTALRAKLAAKAFAHTAHYDSLIAAWLARQTGDIFAPTLLDAIHLRDVSYGENPHQSAALYGRVTETGGVANARQLHGKPLSYNNLQDADAAWAIAREQQRPSVAIIKHMNPCGVAAATTLTEAFSKALAADPLSAFGGVIACNQTVDMPTAEAMAALFIEVLIAPDIAPDAQAFLAEKKKNLRMLVVASEHANSPLAALRIKSISGGYLAQTADVASTSPETWKWVSTAKPASDVASDAAFAWGVVKHVASNAIVLVKDGQTIGIGAGQMSRVEAVRMAIAHAERHGHATRGAVLASDAFFPFADNIALAAEAGIATVIQPGGSKRDDEVIAAANEAGIAMCFTGRRHFRH